MVSFPLYVAFLTTPLWWSRLFSIAALESIAGVGGTAADTLVYSVMNQEGYWDVTNLLCIRNGRNCWTPEGGNKLQNLTQQLNDRKEALIKMTESWSAKIKAINKIKACCWQDLLNEVSGNLWRLGYKLKTRKASGALQNPCSLEAEQMNRTMWALLGELKSL